EYKGEHLLDTRDTRDEEKIGEIWQNLAPENYFFRLVSKDKIGEVIDSIEKK
ncbi:unnamed protein product, partial [marine sediment metagenome]